MPPVPVPVPALKPLLEILYLRDNGAYRPIFTVDLVPKEVDILDNPGGQQIFFNGNNYRFQPKDNILITEIGMRLPFCFCFGSQTPRFDLFWTSTDNLETIALNCSGEIPINAQGISLAGGNIQGFFAPYPDWQIVPKTTEAKLRIQLDFGKVSMINVPAVFSGEELKIDMWVKVQHLIPLQTDPP